MANHASHAVLPFPIRGARFTVQIPYLDADGDPTDPTTPDTQVSKDGGAFAACTEEVTTISGSNGVGYITLSGAETDCSMLAIAAKVASGPKNTLLTFQPRLLADVENGTAQNGAAGSITLASGAAAFDLTGCFVKTTGGTGGGGTGGADNQVRRIRFYDTSTKTADVEPNWETAPDDTDTFVIYGYSKVDVRFWLGNAVTVDPVLSKPDVNVNSWGDSTVAVTNLKTLYNDSTAAANQKAFFDGTGYTGGSIKLRTNPVQLDGDGTAIDNLRDWALGMVVGSVSGTPANESIFVTDLPATTDGYYNGAYLSFIAGPASGQARMIVAYDQVSKQITVKPAFKTMPADTNTFVISGSSYGDTQLWAGSAVTLSNNNRPDVNIGEISDSEPAANNAEVIFGPSTLVGNMRDFFDGTGYPGGTEKLQVDLREVNGDTGASLHFLNLMKTIKNGACTATTNGAVTFSTDLTDADDYWVGSLIRFYNGNNADQVRLITAYSADNGIVTVSPALPNITSDGNGFVIWGSGAADLRSIRDNEDAAVRLESYLNTMTAQAVTGTPSADIFDTTLSEATPDHYNGSYIGFHSGPLDGQLRMISDYDGAGRITVYPSFTGAPNSGDGFIIFGCSDVDMHQIAGQAAAATVLEAIARTGIRGACTATTTGTTTFSSDLAEADDDRYNGMIIGFYTGQNIDTARMITDYSGTNGTITVSPALPNNTANGDDFVIWGTAAANLLSVHDDPDASARFERYLDTMTAGSVTGTPAADAFDTSLTEATPDHYKGSYIGFNTGVLDGQYRQITAYDGAGRINVLPAFTEPPANGSGFIIFGCSQADVRSIGGETIPADNMERYFTGQSSGSVAGSPAADSFDTDLPVTTNGHYSWRFVTFTSGNLAGQTRPIKSYTGATKKVSVDPSFTQAPTITDEFVIHSSAHADIRAINGAAGAADNLHLDYDGTGYNKPNSLIGICGSLADGSITSATFATDAITAAVVATGAWEEAADQVMIRATSNFEASAPKKSLATAVMQAVHRVDDDGTGNLDIYRSDGTTVHATRTVTTNAALDPIDELGGAT